MIGEISQLKKIDRFLWVAFSAQPGWMIGGLVLPIRWFRDGIQRVNLIFRVSRLLAEGSWQ